MATDWYVGIGGKARRIVKAYIGVNGKAREIVGGYVGIGGKAREFFGSGKIEFDMYTGFGETMVYNQYGLLKDYLLCMCPRTYNNLTREVVPFNKSFVRNDTVEGSQYPRATGAACTIDDDYAISVKRPSTTTSTTGTSFRYDNNLTRITGTSLTHHQYGSYVGFNRKAYLAFGSKSASGHSSRDYFKTIDVLSEDLVKGETITDSENYTMYPGACATTNYAMFFGMDFAKVIDKNGVCTTLTYNYLSGVDHKDDKIANTLDKNTVYVSGDQNKGDYVSINNNLVVNRFKVTDGPDVSRVASRKWFSSLRVRNTSLTDNGVILYYWGTDFVEQQMNFGNVVPREDNYYVHSSTYWPSVKAGVYLAASSTDNSNHYANMRLIVIKS